MRLAGSSFSLLPPSLPPRLLLFNPSNPIKPQRCSIYTDGHYRYDYFIGPFTDSAHSLSFIHTRGSVWTKCIRTPLSLLCAFARGDRSRTHIKHYSPGPSLPREQTYCDRALDRIRWARSQKDAIGTIYYYHPPPGPQIQWGEGIQTNFSWANVLTPPMSSSVRHTASPRPVACLTTGERATSLSQMNI